MSPQLARLGRLIRKELSEILRDRRTILTLVVMPLLLYPLLSVAFRQFFLASGLATGRDVEFRVGFLSPEERAWFDHRITLGEQALQARGRMAAKNPSKDDATEPATVTTRTRVSAREGTAEELEAALRAGEIDAYLRRGPSRGQEPRDPPPEPLAARDMVRRYEIVYKPGAAGAAGLLDYFEERLAAINEADLLRRLNRADVRPPSLVIRLQRAPLDDAGGSALVSLAALVPLILILMTITGAVYPAIDLTAGERERGTLEILVAAPVPRLGLLFAKYVSVVTVAVLTALVNLVAMTSTLLLSGLGPLLFPQQGLSIGTIFGVFGLLLLFAAFFSAVLLCITSFARSFKEAQAYLIPLMLVSLAPGVIGMLPGLKLADWAVAPLVNIVLLGRDLFEAKAEFGPAFIVVAATLTYAFAALGLAARIFGAENVLYNEQTNWADLFRRPPTPQACASVTAALWCLALMIPLNFVLQGTALLLVQGGLLTKDQQVVLGPLHALVLFGVLPWLFAWSGRLQLTSAFAMNGARWLAWLGGIVLGVSLWPIVFGGVAQLPLRPDEAQQELYQQVAESLRRLTMPVRLALVVVPALLEEWFFRGYLYGAVRRRAGAAVTIAVTALLFGVTHFVFRPELGVVRLLPSAALGLALGGVREASGSVGPGMLLHAFHNSLLVLLLHEETGELSQVPLGWVAAGLAGSGVGVMLLWWGRRAAPLGQEVAS